MVGTESSGEGDVPIKCLVLCQRLRIQDEETWCLSFKSSCLVGYVTCQKANITQYKISSVVVHAHGELGGEERVLVLPGGARKSITKDAVCGLRTGRSTGLSQGQNQDNPYM